MATHSSSSKLKNRKVWTLTQLIAMPKQELRAMEIAIRAKAWRLLGIDWKKEVRSYRDLLTGDLVIEWE